MVCCDWQIAINQNQGSTKLYLSTLTKASQDNNWHPKYLYLNLGFLQVYEPVPNFLQRFLAKISFNIILLNLNVRIIANFLLINLFVFNLWWRMFDRYISISDRKLSIPNEYLINRFASIVWKKSIVRQISITKIVMVAPQRACRPLREDVVEWKGNPCIPDLYFQNRN